MINKEKALIIGILVTIIGINLFFGLPRVSKYTAGDETLWSYDRVPKFWRSIKKGNWRGTSLCDKPGITLAMISGIGLPFIPDPQNYEDLRYKPKSPEQIATIEKIYYSLRLPVYLFALASLIIFYFLIKRLLGMRTALFSLIFIGLSPILLGISLIINTDALLWILMPISILSFLIYQKEGNPKFLYLTGFLLGVGILDKFVANFLFPFFLVLIFIKYILGDYPEKETGIAYFKKALLDYLKIVAVALLTIFILYPSAWIKPKELLNTTIYSLAFKNLWPFFVGALVAIIADVFTFKSRVSRAICDVFMNNKKIFIQIILSITLLLIFFVLLNTYTGMSFLNFEEILAKPKADLSFFHEFFPNLLASFFPLLYGLTPIVAFLFILMIVLMLLKVSKNKLDDDKTAAFSILLFILLYYFANSLSEISSTVRYQIIIYPLASIIAAIGLTHLISSEKIKDYFSGGKFYFLIFLLIIFSFISLYNTKPFFLAYSSNLLPKQYVLNLKDMGDGSWEISQYLNNLPEANRLNVWSDKKQVCEKFIGKCDTGFNIKNIGNQHFDYFIASRGGRGGNNFKGNRSGGRTIQNRR